MENINFYNFKELSFPNALDLIYHHEIACDFSCEITNSLLINNNITLRT